MSEIIEKSLDQFIRRFFAEKKGNYDFFIGSGASISSGIPSGRDMIWEFKENIIKSKDFALFQIINNTQLESDKRQLISKYFSDEQYPKEGDDSEYSFYFELCFDSKESRRNYISEKIRYKNPKIGYQLLGRLLLDKYINQVWTTNFDHLIEAGYKYHNDHQDDIKEIGQMLTSSVDSLSENDIPIFKLHGDEKYDINLRNTLKETNKLSDDFEEIFSNRIKNKGLIFVGYSGADTSIMSILEKNLDNSSFLQNGIIWFNRKGDTLSDKVKHLMERACDINPKSCVVTIDNFDNALIKFLEYLSIKLSKNDFKKSLRTPKRYENIFEKIIRTENNKEYIELQDQNPLEKIIKKIDKRCYLLKGIQGIGKTDEIENLYYQIDLEQNYYPFLMDLSNFQGLFELPLASKTIPTFLLLDNLERLDRTLIIDLIKAVNLFLSKNEKNKVVISGRPLAFVEEFNNIVNVISIKLLPAVNKNESLFHKAKDDYSELINIPFYKNRLITSSSSHEKNSIIYNTIKILLSSESDHILWSKKITQSDLNENSQILMKLLLSYSELAHFLYIKNQFCISKKELNDFLKLKKTKNEFYASSFLDIDEKYNISFTNKFFFDYFCACYYSNKSAQEIKNELFFSNDIKISAYPILKHLLLINKEKSSISNIIISQLQKQSEAYIFFTNYKLLTANERFSQYKKILDEFNRNKQLIYYGRFQESSDLFSTIESLSDKMFELLPDEKQLEAVTLHIATIDKFLSAPNNNDLKEFSNAVILLGFGEEKRWNAECQVLLKQISIPLLDFFLHNELSNNIKGLLSSLVVFLWYKTYGWTKDWGIKDWNQFIIDIKHNSSEDFYDFLDEDDYKLKRSLFIRFNENPVVWNLLIPLSVYSCLSNDVHGHASHVPAVLDDEFQTSVLHFDEDLFYFRYAIQSESSRIKVQEIIEIANQVAEKAAHRLSRDYESRELVEELSKQYLEKISQLTIDDVPVLFSILKNVIKDNNGLYSHDLIRYIIPMPDKIKIAIYANILSELKSGQIVYNGFALLQPMSSLLNLKENSELAITYLKQTKSISFLCFQDIFFFCKRGNDNHICKKYCNEQYELEFPEKYKEDVLYQQRKELFNTKIELMRKNEIEFITSSEKIISEIDRILDYLDSDQNPFKKDSERMDLIYLEPEHTFEYYEYELNKESKDPEVFSEFVLRILRDASFNDEKTVNRELVKDNIKSWGDLQQNFWRFFYWYYIHRFESEKVELFLKTNTDIVNKIKQSMEFELPEILESQDISIFDGGKNRFQLVPFIYYLENIFEEKIPDYINPQNLLKFVAFPAWCLSEYGVHTTGDYKWGKYENVFEWLGILLKINQKSIIDYAISVFPKLESDISKTQIVSCLCDFVLQNTLQSEDAISLIIQESIKEITYEYKQNENLTSMNYVLQNFWNKYEDDIVERIDTYIDFAEYKNDEKNYCRRAMSDYIIKFANHERKKKIISGISKKTKLTILSDDNIHLLARLGDEKSTIHLIDQYLGGKKLDTHLYWSGSLFGIENASKKVFRKIIDLFVYTLKKSNDRRRDLHEIAVGMINTNVNKNNFRILKKSLEKIIKDKKSNNEYFEYVQNYLKEIEQKVYR